MAILDVENASDAVTLQFKMDGPVFDSGISVHIMVDALGQVQGIMDKAYLGLVDRRRITKDERARFYLQSQSVVRSSLLTDLGVVFTGFQTVFPFFGAIGPTGVWEYAKQTFEFLKLVFEAVKSNQHVSYEWRGDRSVFHVNTGTQTQTFNGPVYNIAQMSIHHYQGLAQHLEINRVTDIQLGRETRREIGISLLERDLFQFPSRVEEAPHRVRCEISTSISSTTLESCMFSRGKVPLKPTTVLRLSGNRIILRTSRPCSARQSQLRVFKRLPRTLSQVIELFACRSSKLNPNRPCSGRCGQASDDV